MQARFKFGLLFAIAGVAAAGGNVFATPAQDELAEMRQVTARFHDLDVAIAAGYELGYVNGAGNQDHHRLRRAPDRRGHGLPLLQQGTDRRPGH